MKPRSPAFSTVYIRIYIHINRTILACFYVQWTELCFGTFFMKHFLMTNEIVIKIFR